MNGTLTASDGLIYLNFPYRKNIVDAVRNLPDRKFDYIKKCWTVPVEHRIAVEKFAHSHRFTWAIDQPPEKELPVPDMPELKTDILLKRDLYPYQKTGVAYTLQHMRVIVGDEPGLGKTGQSIASVLGAGMFPCLIICPSSLKENWRREWAIWTNKRAMILQDSIKISFPKYWEHGMADVFIVNYESLKKYFVAEMPDTKPSPEGKKKRITLKDIKFKSVHKDMFKSVIVDESHRCKSFSTQQTKFVKGICSGKEMILALTGTPVINKPIDLVPQLGIIDQLKAFGGYKSFLERYCAGQKEASNLKELNQVLKTHCFYRREKKEVLKDLPDKVRQLIYCEISNRREYKDAEADLIRYLKEYKQASDESVEKSMRGEIMVRMGILKNISARGKLADVIDYVDDILESGEKLVIFGHLKEVIAAVKKHYPHAVTITGDDDSKSRQNAVDSFQGDPKTNLILCSIRAAGVGLTLTASSHVAFMEQDWTAAAMEQCEDRCHRIGQKDSVQCTYFLGKDTIDEDIYRIIDSKRNIAATITGTVNTVQENVIDNLISLFNQR